MSSCLGNGLVRFKVEMKERIQEKMIKMSLYVYTQFRFQKKKNEKLNFNTEYTKNLHKIKIES